MILLVDLCHRPGSLSRDEFVGPVARIVSRAGEPWRGIHFSRAGDADLDGIAGIILCGTALQDNRFAEQAGWPAPLIGTGLPVLGICAGMQALCLACGGSIRPAAGIGMTKVRRTAPDPLLGEEETFDAYEVHSFACEPPPGWIVTAVSDTGVQAFRHPDRPLFGVMFHPEVRNDRVIERFCTLCRGGVART
jgi:GMP synthase (glutamine-hydrolysing)